MLEPQVDVDTEFEAVPPNQAYEDIIQEAAAEYDMDPALIRAVMQTESAFHPYAVSRAGAEGLMQLMPALADEMGVSDSFDPRENRSEEHTSELQSQSNLVCRLLLEKKKQKKKTNTESVE